MVLLYSAAKANTGAEIYAANVNISDAKNQYGCGISIITDINRNIRAAARGIYTIYPDERSFMGSDYDVEYSYYTALLGVEYDPPVDFLSVRKLHWRNSVYCGYSHTEVKVKDLEDAEADDSGIAFALNTGMGYDYTQHMQFFIEFGWHQSFYRDEFKDSKIYGGEVLAGVRFALFDIKRLEDDY